MRIALLLFVFLLPITGCQSQSSPAPDSITSLLREQNDELKSLRTQVVLLQHEVIAIKDRPSHVARETLPAPAPQFNAATSVMPASRKYAITAGRAAGQANMDAIYVTHVESARLVAMMFNADNEKLEIIAGRDIGQDVKAGRPRGRAPWVPADATTAPNLIGNAGVTMARGAANEDVLVIIDDANERLLIYKLDAGRKRLELSAIEDLRKLFDIKAVRINPPANNPAILPAPAPTPSPVPPIPDTPPPPLPPPGKPPF